MAQFEHLQTVLFDLDGTLTESKQPLQEEMGTRLAYLSKKIPIAIFSGGSLRQFEKQVLPYLPPKTFLEQIYLFPTSAAQCLRFEDGAWRLVYHNNFTDEEKKRIIAALQSGIEKTHIIDETTPQFGERIEDRGSQISFSALGQNAPIELKKVWDPDRKKRTPLWQFLSSVIPKYHIAMNASNTIDITKKGINKGYGIEKFSDLLHIPIARMLYIGDALFAGGNDEIVKKTGIETYSVANPLETATLIDTLLSALP